MRIVEKLEDAAAWCGRYRASGLSVGFVPTLGALHRGHASLIERARAECDRAVASIFVNPTQFGPGEDFTAYPRPREKDLALCRAAGVDLVYLARAEEIYPPGFQTWVTVEEVSKPLCGVSRPIHFRGVATVVTQLFAVVRPHRAYFGAKDYQQTLVVRRLVADLHLDTEVRVEPTVREADGLAMSSRNAYLDAEARSAAPRIRAALLAARTRVLEGETRTAAVLDRLREVLRPDALLELEYAEVRDATTLQEFPDGVVRSTPGGVVIAVAARAKGTRLIDNVVIPPDGPASP